MAGLLDGLTGDNTTKDEYGQTQADRRDPIWSGLIKAGLLAVAGGGNLMPEQRARYLAEAGGALGDIPNQMIASRSAAAQNVLRSQQLDEGKRKIADRERLQAMAQTPEFQAQMAKLDPAEQMLLKAAVANGDLAHATTILGNVGQAALRGQEVQSKAADLAQKEKMRAYANSPEVQEMIAKLPPDRRAGAMGAALAGNWEAFSKYLEPVKSTISQGWIVAPDGKTAFDTLTNTRMVLGPNGWEKVPGGAPSPTPTPPPAPPSVGPPGAFPELAPGGPAAPAAAPPTPSPPQFPQPGTENYPGMDKLPQPHQFDQAKFDALDPWLKPHVLDILSYNKPMPGFVRGGVQGLAPRQIDAVNNAVTAVTNGTYRQPNFARIDQAVKDFDNPKGLGGTIDASNILVGHLQQFHDYARALNNNDTQTANIIKNEWARKTGNPNISAYEMMEQAVGSEAMKSITNHATEGTLEGWKKPLSSFSSPAQMQAVVEGLVHAMQERDKQYTYDWNQRTLGTRPRASFLRPDVQRAIESIKANPLGGKPAAAAPGGGPALAEGEKNLGQLPDGGWKIQKADGSIVRRQ